MEGTWNTFLGQYLIEYKQLLIWKRGICPTRRVLANYIAGYQFHGALADILPGGIWCNYGGVGSGVFGCLDFCIFTVHTTPPWPSFFLARYRHLVNNHHLKNCQREYASMVPRQHPSKLGVIHDIIQSLLRATSQIAKTAGVQWTYNQKHSQKLATVWRRSSPPKFYWSETKYYTTDARSALWSSGRETRSLSRWNGDLSLGWIWDLRQ